MIDQASLSTALDGFVLTPPGTLMKHGIGMRNITRGVTAGRIRALGWSLVAAALAGCHTPSSPSTAPELPDPAVFAMWPQTTEAPIQVTRAQFALCVINPPVGHMTAIWYRPDRDHSMVVRVSPNAIAAYREGRPLPDGAVVVKEKYDNASASGPLQAYGVMIKRAAGYDPRGGDWEYGFVTLGPDPVVTRGRLARCAGCHASARGTDYLFRPYVETGRRSR